MPASPTPVPSADRGDRSLGRAAIGDFPPGLVAELASFYWKKYGIDVEILLASPLDQSAIDVSEDLYIRDRPDWHWAFGVRGDSRYAVISTARMGGLAEPVAPIVMSRLRKMVTRDIDVMYYGLPLNDDRYSVLYSDILSLDDLDRMDEEDCGLDCPLIGSTSGERAFASRW